MAEHRPPGAPDLAAEVRRVERALQEVLAAVDDLASIVAAHPEERPSMEYVAEHINAARTLLARASAGGERRRAPRGKAAA